MTIRSNGKLLLTGEYVVLDGAEALALPTRYGQDLTVTETKTNRITWISYDEFNAIWFDAEFIIQNNTVSTLKSSNQEISQRLVDILNATQRLNPEFLNKGYAVKTRLDFNRQWGLGTSSTLIANVAKWAKTNPYQLLNKTFGGSGYDIACAQYNTPIRYQLSKDNTIPTVIPVTFTPSFAEQLYFVYLNKKQNSRDGIAKYRAYASEIPATVAKINTITQDILSTQQLSEFERLITDHEACISKLIKEPTVKATYFSDFEGCIKSLGAWGGDFILVTSLTDPRPYFASKGLDVVIPYTAMVLN